MNYLKYYLFPAISQHGIRGVDGLAMSLESHEPGVCHYSKVEAPVKAVAEHCQAAGQILLAHRIISASRFVLRITDHRVNPLEVSTGITHGNTAGQQGLKGKPGITSSAKKEQGIGSHKGVSDKVLLAKQLISLLAKYLTQLKRIAIRWPSKLIETAASKVVLPVAPRPRRISGFLPSGIIELDNKSG